jgi:hypothetical protein
MKRNILLMLFSLTSLLFAQTNNPSTGELKRLTVEEKLDVAVSNSMSYLIMGISYVKSLGKTPEEFAEYSANLVIPAYQFLREKKPFDMINIINQVQQTDKHFALEITEVSDSNIKGKMNLFGINNIKAARGAGGVTVDDCYRYYNKFVETLSSGVGFKYVYNVKEDWIEFKLSTN